MSGLNSLPIASDAQIRAMQATADKMMKAEGIVIEEPKQEVPIVDTLSSTEDTQEQNVFPDSSSAPESGIETLPTTENKPSTVEVAPKPAPQESFRALREKAEKAERERDEALRYVKDMQSRSPQQQQAEPEQAEEPEVNINDEDLVEGKHLNKIRKELYALRQEAKQRQQQSTEMAVEAKLKAQYPDFDKIVSIDNLKDLQFKSPHLARSIHANPDMESKAIAAYEAIKNMQEEERSIEMDKERTLKNAAKPRPLTSISPQQGESPLTKANAFAQGLTDDLKQQLRREMEQARRNM